ncbi:flagellar export protein FliJ [Oricola cellulosilytica]|uniref:Flagellar export protein FliJ n=1 Tax=Oricola cellulosilytica TaxID=1429082 RepID=A0A4R0PFE1_9HYPH|nr:flagellar export protein FliJ [Oricola cellulosilytica]TCD15378.1 flagellar export protein FliJ [Oricola cellulosilytica]
MKPRDNMIRLRQFKVAEKHRQVMQLETMIAEFDRMASELDAQITTEEKKAGISDTSHFAYPTFAKAARTRRDNLEVSIRDLKQQKDSAETELLEAESELQKAERLEVREARGAEIQNAPAPHGKAMIG